MEINPWIDLYFISIISGTIIANTISNNIYISKLKLTGFIAIYIILLYIRLTMYNTVIIGEAIKGITIDVTATIGIIKYKY
jgi:uncharacterized protein with HEPN domain